MYRLQMLKKCISCSFPRTVARFLHPLQRDCNSVRAFPKHARTATDDPTRDERAFLDERIYEYNVAATNIHDGRMMYFAVRDVQGDTIAGLSGWTWGGCAAVEFLWVREDWRGKGFGTQLLAAAEAEALARGCTQIVLDTHSFQAPEFYKKHGYVVYGMMDDYPRGFAHIHLKKALRRTDTNGLSWTTSA